MKASALELLRQKLKEQKGFHAACCDFGAKK